jgi:surface antigen
MRGAKLFIVAWLTLGLAACETAGGTDSTGGRGGELVGTLGGAAAGGLLGSQVGSGKGKALATLAGTLVGGYLGNRLGAKLDARDRQVAEEAERDAVVENRTTTWLNRETGDAGEVRPRRTYVDSDGRTCREYDHAVTIEGKQEIGTGVACRDENGNWTLVAS